ncbi:class I SAM-dependent methyltransferase [Ruegeria sp. HKCCA4633]|uniref:class I SAM-dependent methyltransferase n=1 Tax=Ruegeria sp. HKCCA4633 TaxID=2682983 RepID=UPI001489A129|nr:class I SAM-dependent methyltransferase [Ruegeria sp. HKCCA4633]
MNRIKVLVFSGDGARLVSNSGLEKALNPKEVLEAIPSTDAFLFLDKPKWGNVPSHLEAQICESSAAIPFFITETLASDPDFLSRLNGVTTIFDRILIEGGSVQSGVDVAALDLAVSASADPIQLTLANLQAEEKLKSPEISEYQAKDHWEQRAKYLGNSSRAICYSQSSRRINKLMHWGQIKALAPVIQKAASYARSSPRKPELLEYGCGIGRLVPYCAQYTRYHGVDISSSMIKTAKTLNPEASFYMSEDLAHLQDLCVDLVLIVTVLHHNDKIGRLAIWKNLAEITKDRFQLIILEDFLIQKRNKSAQNMYRFGLNDLLDEIAEVFGGSCTLNDFQMIGYKPSDLVPRAGLLSLQVVR